MAVPSLLRIPVTWVARFRGRRLLAQFLAQTRRVRQVQEALLLEKVRRNTDSQFGRDHHFDEIHDIASFRRRLPVAGYEAFAPYIDRVRQGDLGAMFGGRQQVHLFALTSGTTAPSKFIPITDQYLKEYRRSWLLWCYTAYRAHPRILDGLVFSLFGDYQETSAPSGVPCGSISGLVAQVQPRAARWLYCLPNAMMKIKDIRTKYYCAMRLAVAEPRISISVVANPATMIGAARLANEQKEGLVRDIADGTLTPPEPLAPAIAAALAPRIRRPHPQRARVLEEIIHRTGSLYPKDYWPRLVLMANWVGGTMAPYLRHYPPLFGGVPVRDHGLTASEGRMTIPLADGTSAGVLDIVTHFFEFIPEEAIETSDPPALLAHELERGRSYYILLTTNSGLYRYHIGDVVRCVDFLNEAPVLEFLNKGSHCSSVAGEKLAEAQVVEAVRRSIDALGLALHEFTLAPCWDDPPYYVLLVEETDLASRQQGERLAECVDGQLLELNIEYRAKRESLRLGRVQFQPLPGGTWRRFKADRLRQTRGSAEQYKHPCLVPDVEFAQRLVPPQPTTPAQAKD